MSTITPLEERLNNQECRNWIKVCHALTILQEGMGEFCNTFKNNLHTNILGDSQTKGMFVQCTLGCSRKPNYNWCDRCSTWKAIICKYHVRKSTQINWSAADSSLWMNDPDEVAKIFRPEKSKDGPFGADLMDYLYLLRSCKMYTNSNSQVLHDVIGIRNNIFHCSSLQLSDTQVKEFILKMKDLLRSCYSDINRCPSASNAFSELKKIELRKITMAQVESSEEFSDVRQLLCGLLDRRLKHMEDMYVRKDRHVRGEDRLKKKKIVRLIMRLTPGCSLVVLVAIALLLCTMRQNSLQCERLKGGMETIIGNINIIIYIFLNFYFNILSFSYLLYFCRKRNLFSYVH